MQVQLDGSVRTSGTGEPSIARIIEDMPRLDSVRTGFLDGMGPQID
jgi:hypothetical protein